MIKNIDIRNLGFIILTCGFFSDSSSLITIYCLLVFNDLFQFIFYIFSKYLVFI